MAKKQSQKKRPQKQKIEWRRVFVAGLAVVMALLLLLPMISMIAGGVGAVTQSEIDALKEEQRESQVKQQELKNQLADVKEDQAAAQQRRQLLQQQLEAINAELDSINAQISYYDQEIAQKEAERREAEAKEQAQYELFCERVRAMEEEGTVSYWSILFNAENFSDMLDRLADIDAVMDYDNQVMEELTAARQELERLQAECHHRLGDQLPVAAARLLPADLPVRLPHSPHHRQGPQPYRHRHPRPWRHPHSGLQERTGGHLRLPLLLRQLRGHRPRQR